MRRLIAQRNLTIFAVVTSLFFVAIATMLVVNSISEGWLDAMEMLRWRSQP